MRMRVQRLPHLPIQIGRLEHDDGTRAHAGEIPRKTPHNSRDFHTPAEVRRPDRGGH